MQANLSLTFTETFFFVDREDKTGQPRRLFFFVFKVKHLSEAQNVIDFDLFLFCVFSLLFDLLALKLLTGGCFRGQPDNPAALDLQSRNGSHDYASILSMLTSTCFRSAPGFTYEFSWPLDCDTP